MRNEKTIIILLILTLSLSGLMAWHLFAPKGPSRAPLTRANIGDTLANPRSSAPPTPARNSLPISISTSSAASATNSKEKGKTIYYEPETGMVNEVDFSGKDSSVISATRLPGFVRTIWSPTKTEVISEFSPFRFKYFNYATKQSVTFGTGIQSIAFSPDGSQIAYFAKDSQGAGIHLATPDNQTSKQILNTRFSKISVAWPQEKLLTLTVHDDSTGLDSFFTLDTSGKLSKKYEGLTRAETVWSRDGSKALISSFNEEGVLNLASYTVVTGEYSNLSVEARASQCAWSSDVRTIFCAISETPISPATVENKSKTPHDLYEIDTISKTKKLLFSSGNKSSKVFISEIFLSPAEDYLLFINGFDTKLYSFRL